MNQRHIRIAALALVVFAAAGIGRAEAPPTIDPAAEALAVAGNYPTRATVIAGRNTCGSVSVEDHPTIVRHKTGASTLRLEHAGSAYAGTIDNSGRFSTPAAAFAYPDADYSISISGQFSETGFTATVELAKRARGRTCTYAVAWVATKRGSRNTIPKLEPS